MSASAFLTLSASPFVQAEKDGLPLRRGGLVRESATIAAERELWARQVQQNVRHLVLVVHGIGQRLQDSRFSSDVGDSHAPKSATMAVC